MQDLKRKHTEIIALYTLERELNDIYVEGNRDKVFIGTFLKVKAVNRKVMSVDLIDFNDLEESQTDDLDMRSNRNKVVILAKLLAQSLPNTIVRCVIDKDFDGHMPSWSYAAL